MDGRRSQSRDGIDAGEHLPQHAADFRDAGGEMYPAKSVEVNGSRTRPESKTDAPRKNQRTDDESGDEDAKGSDDDAEHKKGGDDPEKKGNNEKDKSPQQKREEQRKATRKKIIIFIVLAVLLIIGLAVGIPYYLHARHFESTDDAFIDSHAERVGPQVAGRVLRVLADDNQIVKAGDVMIEIDPADFNTAIATADAGVAENDGKLAQAIAQKAVAEAGVEQAKADLQQATVNRQNAEVNLKRNEQLSAEAISRQRLDDLRAAAITAEANQTASEKRLVASQAQVTLADSQIKAAQGQVQSAQAKLDQAKLNLSYTKVITRVGGRVARRDVQAGDYVEVGQPTMSVVPDDVWVTANFKETQLTDMRPGQPVDIEVDAYPDEVFRGRIDSIQAGSGAAFSLLPPENATGNYVKVVQRVPVKITFDDHGSEAYKKLSPGMSVEPKARVR